jgi:Flp pilus assembly pilin Flp
MLRIAQALHSLAVSESGADMLEYALIAALVALLTLNAVAEFGDKHLLKLYTDLAKDFKSAVK